jgi:L-rhamnonate dehydratase
VALPPTEVPYIEFLVKWNVILQHFYKNPVLPVDGYVTVPTGLGMGVELDPAKIEEERDFRVD